MGTRSCKRQHQHSIFNTIDEQPIGLNVAVTITTPSSEQSMISIPIWKKLSASQAANHIIKKLYG